VRLLRKHNVALVIAESARRWPMLQDITADFLYLRLHGDKKVYSSGYSPKALRRWADRIATWSSGDEPPDALKVDTEARIAKKARPVYCFFDNTDEKLRAPADAKTLMKILGLRWPPPSLPTRKRAPARLVSGGSHTRQPARV
jgi:uncharacterized protein YecE (DUF72 family)